MEALTHNRVWDQGRDVPRIRAAFTSLLANSSQWPSPSKFIESLPKIEDKPALPRVILSDEQRVANLDRLAEMAKDVLQ